MSLQKSINAVYDEIIAMTPEEIKHELSKPIENGVGDLLVSAGVDLRKFVKVGNEKNTPPSKI